MPGLARGPWSPKYLSSLVLDLDASIGVTLTSGKVSTWADQSGYGNDYTQATAGSRPVVTASVFGGLPAVTGTASTSMTRATSPLAVGSARTIFAVAMGTGADGASGGTIIDFRQGVGHQITQYFWDLGGTTYVFSNANSSWTASGVTVFDTKHVIGSTVSVGSVPTISVDGVSKTVTAQNMTTDDGTNNSTLMNYVGGGQGFIGHVGRLLVFNAVLSAKNIADVKNYLSTLYGIAVS